MNKIFIFCSIFYLIYPSISEKDDYITYPAWKSFFPYNSEDEVIELTIQIHEQNSTLDAKRYLNNWIDKYWKLPTPSTPPTVTSGDPEITVAKEKWEELTEAPETTDSITEKLMTEHEPYTMHPKATVAPETELRGFGPSIMKVNTQNDNQKVQKTGSGMQKWEEKWFKDQFAVTTPYPYDSRCRSNKEFIRQEALQFLDHRDTVKIYVDYLVSMAHHDHVLTREEGEKVRLVFWKTDLKYDNNFLIVDKEFKFKISKFNTWEMSGYYIKKKFEEYTKRWYKFPAEGERLDWSFDVNPMC